MEENISEEQKKKDEEIGEELVKATQKLFGITEKPTIPNFPINKKAQKKYLKDPFNKKHKKNLADKSIKDTSDKDKK